MRIKNTKRIGSLLIAFLLSITMIMNPTQMASAVASNVTVTIDSGAEVTLSDTNGDGYYEIDTADELCAFSELVNAGEKTVNAIMTADIDMSGIDWKTICPTALYYSSAYSTSYGGNDTGYAGVFNGNGYVIKNLSVTAIEGETWTYGLFGTMTGVVKELGIEGFVYNHNNASDMRTGAIVGQLLGGTVENCYVVDANITPNVNVAGGITGCNYAGTIKNCYIADSKISAERCGYIAGDNRADTNGDRVGTIENCYTDGASITGMYAGTVTNSKCDVNRDYFVNSGIVWYLNNQSVDGVWKQGEKYPCFVGSVVTEPLLDSYQQPELVDGVYQITNKSELYWFACYVNFIDVSVNAILLNNINLEGDAWIPIGNGGAPFTGTFDGGGHSIFEFAMNITTGGKWGLFGFTYNATVKSFSISGSVESNLTEAPFDFNYGVIGQASGNTVVTDVHSSVSFTSLDSYYKNTMAGIIGRNDSTGADFAIERCSFSGTLNLGTAQVDCTGGIIGYIMAGHTAKINNCLFDGKIISEYDGSMQIGGMVGYYRGENLTILNSLSVGTITSTDSTLNGMLAGVLRQHVSANAKLTNNYYIKETQPFGNSTQSDDIIDGYGSQTVEDSATDATTEQLKSGEIAYLLQSGQDTQIWGQLINTNDYPVLNGDKVYQVAVTYCNSTTETGYSNTSEDITDAHRYDTITHVCDYCGEVQNFNIYINLNEDSTYEWKTSIEYGKNIKSVLDYHISSFPNLKPKKDGYNFTGEWEFYLDGDCTQAYSNTTMPGQIVYVQPVFELSVISIDINWDDMEFTYQNRKWNFTTLTYEGDKWIPTEGSGTVTIENNSTLDNNFFVGISFNSTEEGVSGSFNQNNVELLAKQEITFKLSLFGEPKGESFTDKSLGNITIDIKKVNQN